MTQAGTRKQRQAPGHKLLRVIAPDLLAENHEP